MEAALGTEPGAKRKGRAFAEYLEEIGLPVERVLGDLGPAEAGDVVSFFYAGLPDRFKEAHHDPASGDSPEGASMPAKLWCAAVWEADEAPCRAA